MTDFTIHTPESAPEAAQPLLEKSQKAYGMVPNLHAAMAASPSLLDAYQKVQEAFRATSLTKTEQNVVWMTINRYHNCHYCIPAHTGIAHSDKVDAEIITALRAGTELPDAKLEALRTLTIAMLDKRGRLDDGDTQPFFAAGYTNESLADVLVGVAHKTMSNYFNAFFETPIDAPFQKFVDDPMGAKAPA